MSSIAVHKVRHAAGAQTVDHGCNYLGSHLFSVTLTTEVKDLHSPALILGQLLSFLSLSFPYDEIGTIISKDRVRPIVRSIITCAVLP